MNKPNVGLKQEHEMNESHTRFFELETQALIEVGYFDENGKPKQGAEGQRLIELAYENLRAEGIHIPNCRIQEEGSA